MNLSNLLRAVLDVLSHNKSVGVIMFQKPSPVFFVSFPTFSLIASRTPRLFTFPLGSPAMYDHVNLLIS